MRVGWQRMPTFYRFLLNFYLNFWAFARLTDVLEMLARSWQMNSFMLSTDDILTQTEINLMDEWNLWVFFFLFFFWEIVLDRKGRDGTDGLLDLRKIFLLIMNLDKFFRVLFLEDRRAKKFVCWKCFNLYNYFMS